jgi:hypothetical protein
MSALASVALRGSGPRAPRSLRPKGRIAHWAILVGFQIFSNCFSLRQFPRQSTHPIAAADVAPSRRPSSEARLDRRSDPLGGCALLRLRDFCQVERARGRCDGFRRRLHRFRPFSHPRARAALHRRLSGVAGRSSVGDRSSRRMAPSRRRRLEGRCRQSRLEAKVNARYSFAS